ncbi:MAG: hypothetical protein AAGF06_06170 [Pseudomonadota bacterium]
MKVVKKTDEYTVLQKRSERYAVKDAKGKLINGEEKAKILLAEGLIKLTEPAPKPVAEVAPAEEEAPAEDAAE